MQKIVLKRNEEIRLSELLQNEQLTLDPNGQYIINLKVEEGFLYLVERFENRKLKSFVIVTKDLETTIQKNSYSLRTFYNDCIAHFSISKKEDCYDRIQLYQSSMN